jgi:hypothetical protein
MSLEINVPEVWENRTVHTFVTPARQDGFAANITVAPHDTEDPLSLEDVVKQSPLSDALDDLLVIERGYKTRGVSRYHERTYRFVEPMQGLLLQQRQRFIMIKRKPHIFTFTDVVESFDQNAPALDEVFERMLAVKAQA